MSEHTLTAIGVVLDCEDPDRLADFWQAVVGFEVRTGDATRTSRCLGRRCGGPSTT